LTRREAEALALKKNPQITIGKLRALLAEQYVREQRTALLPTAYLSLTGATASDGARISAGALNNPIIYPRAATGATVSQLITDFGRTTNLASSAESSAKAEQENSAATTAQIVLAVDQAFYNGLETKRCCKWRSKRSTRGSRRTRLNDAGQAEIGWSQLCQRLVFKGLRPTCNNYATRQLSLRDSGLPGPAAI
jgi:outer membrane protein